MKERNEETKLLENEILNAGMRLTTLNNENIKFKQVKKQIKINHEKTNKTLIQGIEDYENEIKIYAQRMDENKSQEIVLNTEYSKLKSLF